MLGPKPHYYLDIIFIVCTTHQFTYVLIQSTNIYWAHSFMLGTVLGAEDMAGQDRLGPCSPAADILVAEDRQHREAFRPWAVALTVSYEPLILGHSFIHSFIQSTCPQACTDYLLRARQIQFALQICTFKTATCFCLNLFLRCMFWILDGIAKIRGFSLTPHPPLL